MPVIFTTVEQFEIGLSGDVEEALKLQRPLPPEHLKIVAKDERIQGGARLEPCELPFIQPEAVSIHQWLPSETLNHETTEPGILFMGREPNTL